MASTKRKNMTGTSPLNDNDEVEGVSGSEGGRGATQDSFRVGRSEGRTGTDGRGGYAFFGDADGHNKDTMNDPQVKPHTVSSLGNDPLRKGSK